MNQKINADDVDRVDRAMRSMTSEERDRQSAISVEESMKEQEQFATRFHAGFCYLCGKPLATFSADSPCLHWLMKPKGFKKKNFPAVGQLYSMFQIETYLRWVATTDGRVTNINDFPEEGTGKIREVTIRYRHLEWSFSLAESDLKGHQASSYSAYPHYHFQMRIDQRPFINFSDFHTPLHHQDLVGLEMSRRHPDSYKIKFPGAEGIGDAFVQENTEALLRQPTVVDAPIDSAGLHISSLLVADEGTTIDGEKVFQLIERARREGVSIASLLSELPNASAMTTITPGPGVVEQAARKGGRGGD